MRRQEEEDSQPSSSGGWSSTTNAMAALAIGGLLGYGFGTRTIEATALLDTFHRSSDLLLGGASAIGTLGQSAIESAVTAAADRVSTTASMFKSIVDKSSSAVRCLGPALVAGSLACQQQWERSREVPNRSSRSARDRSAAGGTEKEDLVSSSGGKNGGSEHVLL